MSEFSPLRVENEGYGACDDEEQEKALALLLRLGSHFRPQCGRFRGFSIGAVPANMLCDWRCSCEKPPESPLLRDFRRR